MPLDAQCDLLEAVRKNVGRDGKRLKGNPRAQLRKNQVALQLRAWQRIEQTIDRNWDPDDMPAMNLAPPNATGLPSGVAPSAVKDPQLRAEYEAAIEANRQKAARYRLQSRARKLKKRWIRHAERFIIRTYIQPPARLAELEALLNVYVADAAKRARILDAVKNKKMPDDLILRNTTQPAKGATFGPVMERVVPVFSRGHMFLDLDSGKFAKMPGPSPDEQAQLDWADRSQVDVYVLTDKDSVFEPMIAFLGATVLPLKNVDWNDSAVLPILGSLSRPTVRGTLSKADVQIRGIASDEKRLPVTYAFRTRHGGAGILQIVGFTDKPKGIKIRYKMLQQAKGGKPTTQPAPDGASTQPGLVQDVRLADRGPGRRIFSGGYHFSAFSRR